MKSLPLGAVVLIGALTGLAATGFHFLADRFGELIFASIETRPVGLRFPLIVLIPTLGLFLVGLVLQYFPQSTKGGIREVAESLDQEAGVIPWTRIVNVILSGFVLAFGGSVGPEGPLVQMGATLASKVGQYFRSNQDALKMMVRAGAAAGIAAAFRSPAGGILLTVEVFGARFNRELPAIGIAAVLGYLTRTALLGRDYPFGLAYWPEPLSLFGLLVIAPLMGVTAAPTGHLFIRMMERLRTLFPAKWPLAFRVALGGFLVGCLGVFYPEVMSAGYRVVERALDGQIGIRLFLILLPLKMLATSITFGSRGVGGLFAPTLFMGAMFGGAFGFGFQALYPAAVPQPEIFVLLGMVALFGSIVKGYWSGLLMVADMSGCYHVLLLPGIISGGISYVLGWELYDRSVFGLRIDGSQSPVASRQSPVVDDRQQTPKASGKSVARDAGS